MHTIHWNTLLIIFASVTCDDNEPRFSIPIISTTVMIIMHWIIGLSIFATVLTSQYAASESFVSGNHVLYKHGSALYACNWSVQLNCRVGSSIDITNVTFDSICCHNCKACKECPKVDGMYITREDINHAIYKECDGEATCDTLPLYPNIRKDKRVIKFTVFYNCTALPQTTTENHEPGSNSSYFSDGPTPSTSTTLTTSTQTSAPNGGGSEETPETTTMSTTVLSKTTFTSETSTARSTAPAVTTINTRVATTSRPTPEAATMMSTTSAANSEMTSTTMIPTPMASTNTTRPFVTTRTTTFIETIMSASSQDAVKVDSSVTALAASVPTVLVLVGVAIVVIVLVIRRRRQKRPKSTDTIKTCPSMHVAIQRTQSAGHANNNYESGEYLGDGNNTNKETAYTGYTEIGEITNADDNVEYNTVNLRTFDVKSDPLYNHVDHTANQYGGSETMQVNDGSYAACGENTTQVDGAYSRANLREKAKRAEPNYNHINMIGS